MGLFSLLSMRASNSAWAAVDMLKKKCHGAEGLGVPL